MKLAGAARVLDDVLLTGAVMTSRSLVLALGFASLLAGADVAAQVSPTDPTGPSLPVVPIDAAEREAVSFLLRAIHELPAADAFVEAAERPVEVLWAIALDDAEPAFVRDRAVLALGYWPDERLWAFLYARATSGVDEMSTHNAIAELARVWPERSLSVVTPLLASSELQVRLSAVDALGRHPAPEAAQSLREALSVEANPVVRDAIERVITLP